jgi:isoamyl acetate esterase
MKIVCFGDSLTRGVSIVRGRLRILKENYPSFLQELFSQNKEADVSVINKGVFNDNSNLLLSRLEKDVVNEKPDYAIIGIGGNDCNFDWSNVAEHPEKEHQAIVPLERYVENVKIIISTIQNTGITPVILNLPPLDPVRYYKNISSRYSNSISHWISKVGGIEHWHSLYNRHLNNLINELGVMKVDVRTALKQAGDLLYLISDDGIHLTSEGYKVLSTEIYQSFANIEEGKQTQPC